ncbi:hypothetical protein DL89DRAFT_266576 [Linderina pennispora]|uniref:F-box domain-containing protein n=1 Tax=Linderina pennispora TaxID=61395 RepID=A0A1Y1WDG2_9FUNG|nr:uncharacterized protein DL89DRAFT_266576 [Linderina pennispora]ORX71569.1 hypothetical protein DL89DRAFT_266576 [Linderina pennispora]
MPSLAQNLPVIIAERVLHFLILGDTTEEAWRTHSNATFRCLRPVSQLCRSWRAASVDRLFEHVCKLPAGENSNPRHANNIHGFLEAIQRLFPAAVYTTVFHGWPEASESWPLLAVELLRGLFLRNTRVSCSEIWLTTVPGLISDDACLQGIDATIMSPSPHFIEIVRRSAPALQHLRLKLGQSFIFKRVVAGDDGAGPVFSQLRRLELFSSTDRSALANGRLVSPDGTPFPALETLSCHMSYPFGNDVLLRGNGQSLRVLDIYISNELLDVFERCSVFASQRFTALACLKLGNLQGEHGVIDKARVVRICNLFQQKTVVEVLGRVDFLYDTLQPYLGDMARTIRVLDIPQLECTFEQIVVLISSLPFLQMLSATCLKSDALASEIDSVHATCTGMCAVKKSVGRVTNRFDNPAQLHFDTHLDIACQTVGFAGSVYASGPPISQRLIDLDIRIERANKRMQAIRLCIILAILCPSVRSFTYYSRTSELTVDRSRFTSNKEFQKLTARVRSSIDNCLDMH